MALPRVPGWIPVRPLATALAVLGSVAVLRRLDGPWDRPWRRRFVLGVPWGTVLTICFVATVYALVQDGWANPFDPVVLPFRSWSYWYPTGMLTSAFAHSGWSHVASNLTATFVYAGLAEYAWGHYPRERGVETFTSLRTNPYARILAVVVFALVVGLFTALFSAGPLIGFSGVVFAFFGVAVALRPLAGALGILAYRILWQTVRALSSPAYTARPIQRVITPSWADTAIHTHALGLLIGVLVGAAICRRRDAWPSPRRVWFAGLAFGILHGLWEVFVPLGNERFRLFRWIGVAAVFALAAVLIATVAREDTSLRPSVGPRARAVGAVIVVVALLAIAVPAVPLNLGPVGEDPAPNAVLEVRDYSIGYGENVPDGYAEAASVPFVDAYPTINRTGVIVTSERRHIWRIQVGASKLRNRGESSFTVGGHTWRERITANWTGWAVLGNGSAYKVFLRRDGGPWRQSFGSDPKRAAVIVAGRNVSIRPAERDFEVVVSRNETAVDAAPIPQNGTERSIGGLTFLRQERLLTVEHNDTRVPIAQRQADTRPE
jgi:membrane associated rhomboid family serine protease